MWKRSRAFSPAEEWDRPPIPLLAPGPALDFFKEKARREAEARALGRAIVAEAQPRPLNRKGRRMRGLRCA